MYKCYACGKEIEHPGDTCPFCRFPVISTLHGNQEEEEEIRKFAEEYRRTNPEYFSAPTVHDPPNIQTAKPNTNQTAVNTDVNKPATTASAQSKPAPTTPVQPKPTQPTPVQPKPTQPASVQPKPVQTAPIQAKPTPSQIKPESEEKKKKKHTGAWIFVLLLIVACGVYFGPKVFPQIKSLISPKTSTATSTPAAQADAASSNSKSGSAASGVKDAVDDAIKDTEQGTSSTTARERQVLRVYAASEPEYLDPALNSAADTSTLDVNLFSGLYMYNEEQQLIPAIASEMPEISIDGYEYTIHLKETTWSNGEPLTAEDFIYSWNRAAADETAADYAYLFDVIERTGDTLAVTALDDYTLMIQLTVPCAYFVDLLAFTTFLPVYKPDVEAADPDKTNPGAWAQEAGFISNGPFTLSSWDHDESMVFIKNENYWDAENVLIDEIEFSLLTDSDELYSAYLTDSLDFISFVPIEERSNMGANPEIHSVQKLGTGYLQFCVNSPIFDGMTPEDAAKIRKAVCLALDRQYIVDGYENLGLIPAGTLIPPGMSDGNGGIFTKDTNVYYDAENPDIERAKELLAEAGYPEGLSLTLLTTEEKTNLWFEETVQGCLAEIGIRVTISQEPRNVYLQDYRDGNFDIAFGGWVADFNDPINMLEVFTSWSGNNNPKLGGDASGYISAAAPQNWAEYDALIKEIRIATDLDYRAGLMHQAEDMLMSTYAVIPVYYYNNVYMCKSNISGIYVTLFGEKYFCHAARE